MTAKTRWGVLGAAGIARKMFLPAALRVPSADVHAIASRSIDKAQTLADTFGANTVYGSYEELFADPEVDAVYVPLPNAQHLEAVLQALRAKKHVLCEKPLAMKASDVTLIQEAAAKAGRHVVEGFMVAYHPQWKQVRDWIDQGEIGTIKRIDGCFTYFLDQPDNIRNRSDGGALRDIGVYPVFASRMISGQTPSRVWGTMQFGEGAESDLSTTAVMQFSDFEASFHVNTRADRTEFITVYGTKGRIEVPKAFNPPNEGTQSIYLFKGNTLAETKCFEDVFQFALQVEHVSKLFKEGGEPVVEMQSSYENQKVIDAVIASVRAEKWVDV